MTEKETKTKSFLRRKWWLVVILVVVGTCTVMFITDEEFHEEQEVKDKYAKTMTKEEFAKFVKDKEPQRRDKLIAIHSEARDEYLAKKEAERWIKVYQHDLVDDLRETLADMDSVEIKGNILRVIVAHKHNKEQELITDLEEEKVVMWDTHILAYDIDCKTHEAIFVPGGYYMRKGEVVYDDSESLETFRTWFPTNDGFGKALYDMLCSKVKVREEEEPQLAYKFLDKVVRDSPVKLQIELDYVVSGEYTKNNLSDLIRKLSVENQNLTGFKWYKHPTHILIKLYADNDKKIRLAYGGAIRRTGSLDSYDSMVRKMDEVEEYGGYMDDSELYWTNEWDFNFQVSQYQIDKIQPVETYPKPPSK